MFSQAAVSDRLRLLFVRQRERFISSHGHFLARIRLTMLEQGVVWTTARQRHSKLS